MCVILFHHMTNFKLWHSPTCQFLRPGFTLWPVSVGFVADGVAQQQVDLCVLLFSPVIVIPLLLHTHILFLQLCHCIVLSTDSVINCF